MYPYSNLRVCSDSLLFLGRTIGSIKHISLPSSLIYFRSLGYVCTSTDYSFYHCTFSQGSCIISHCASRKSFSSVNLALPGENSRRSKVTYISKHQSAVLGNRINPTKSRQGAPLFFLYISSHSYNLNDDIYH